MQAWSQFYTVVGGAAAALLGLLFVVVSMNATATLGAGPGSSKRLAEQAFQNYLAVLLVSLLALYPQISPASFGSATLSVIAIWAVWVMVRFYQTLTGPKEDEPRFLALRRHFSTIAGFGILIYTAVRMALKIDVELNTFASGTIVLLFSATVVSWELLGRIARAEAASKT
jgi:hypothetical protein